MVPLKVTISLLTPMAILNDHPFHFDGLLAGLLAKQLEDAGSSDPWNEALDLSPYLETYAEGEDWVWKASMLFPHFEADADWWASVRRTNPLVYMEAQSDGVLPTRRGSINLESGQERNFFYQSPHRWASRIEAWCVGDQVEISSLLRTATSVGAKRQNGFGRVGHIEVVNDVGALEEWTARPMPHSYQPHNAVDYESASHPLRPPYWDRTNRKLVKMPVSPAI